MLARVRGCVRACAVACARARLRASVRGCVRAWRLRACALACLRACVHLGSQFYLYRTLTAASTVRHDVFYPDSTLEYIFPAFLPYGTQHFLYASYRTTRQNYILSVRACVLACLRACVCAADPFAALVISTPVYNFILNSETTYSYLFILLKNSIGTHLELLKFSISLAVPSLVFARKTCVCLYVPYMSSFNTNFKTFLFPCAHTDEIH